MSDKPNDDGLREADESNNPLVNEPSESSRPPRLSAGSLAVQNANQNRLMKMCQSPAAI